MLNNKWMANCVSPAPAAFRLTFWRDGQFRIDNLSSLASEPRRSAEIDAPDPQKLASFLAFPSKDFHAGLDKIGFVWQKTLFCVLPLPDPFPLPQTQNPEPLFPSPISNNRPDSTTPPTPRPAKIIEQR
jgi:hypothetical protein